MEERAKNIRSKGLETTFFTDDGAIPAVDY